MQSCLTYDSSFLPNGKQSNILQTLSEATQSDSPHLTAVQISNLTGISYPETLYQLKTLELAGRVSRVNFCLAPDASVNGIAWTLRHG